MVYFVKSPWVLKKLYPECIWNFSGDEKNIYITFDDGPHPQATPICIAGAKKVRRKSHLLLYRKKCERTF